ncbi:hypothetical protein GLW05_21550 [Pontibacillus yanchengensis]|uniref:Uncharacterized protein n=1 Tax=Pontibacillus yanchengensis TaxID=462910 RepID=A0A6I5A745_9BACI|nr:hypothetical protein [Pontibacillus yanchengensis]MYL36147.1 hypothetical protein [Pontibacillus yanchengensis]
MRELTIQLDTGTMNYIQQIAELKQLNQEQAAALVIQSNAWKQVAGIEQAHRAADRTIEREKSNKDF